MKTLLFIGLAALVRAQIDLNIEEEFSLNNDLSLANTGNQWDTKSATTNEDKFSHRILLPTKTETVFIMEDEELDELPVREAAAGSTVTVTKRVRVRQKVPTTVTATVTKNVAKTIKESVSTVTLPASKITVTQPSRTKTVKVRQKASISTVTVTKEGSSPAKQTGQSNEEEEMHTVTKTLQECTEQRSTETVTLVNDRVVTKTIGQEKVTTTVTVLAERTATRLGNNDPRIDDFAFDFGLPDLYSTSNTPAKATAMAFPTHLAATDGSIADTIAGIAADAISGITFDTIAGITADTIAAITAETIAALTGVLTTPAADTTTTSPSSFSSSSNKIPFLPFDLPSDPDLFKPPFKIPGLPMPKLPDNPLDIIKLIPKLDDTKKTVIKGLLGLFGHNLPPIPIVDAVGKFISTAQKIFSQRKKGLFPGVFPLSTEDGEIKEEDLTFENIVAAIISPDPGQDNPLQVVRDTVIEILKQIGLIDPKSNDPNPIETLFKKAGLLDDIDGDENENANAKSEDADEQFTKAVSSLLGRLNYMPVTDMPMPTIYKFERTDDDQSTLIDSANVWLDTFDDWLHSQDVTEIVPLFVDLYLMYSSDIDSKNNQM